MQECSGSRTLVTQSSISPSSIATMQALAFLPISRETRVARKFLYCVNGSAWVVSNPVPCHISMLVSYSENDLY